MIKYVIYGGWLWSFIARQLFRGKWDSDINIPDRIRTVVTLKSGINKSGGSGTKSNPYTIINCLCFNYHCI